MELSKIHIFFLILWGLVLAGCLYFYLNFLQPVRLFPIIQSEIQKALPDLRIAGAKLHLFPNPSLSLHGVEFYKEEDLGTLRIAAGEVRIGIAVLPLLKGDVEISRFHVYNPVIFADIEQLPQLTDINSQNSQAFYTAVPPILANTVFTIDKGNLVFNFPVDEEHISLAVNGLNLELNAFKNLSVGIRHMILPQLEPAELWGETELNDFSFSLQSIDISDEGIKAFLNLSGELLLFQSKLSTRFSSTGNMGITQEGLFLPSQLLAEAETSFELPNQKITGKLTLPLSLEGKSVTVTEGKFVAEDNSLTFQAVAPDYSEIAMNGSANLQKLSLSRWFDWARNMPPALSAFLNDISAEGDFEINKEGIKVPQITAKVSGNEFTGSGYYLWFDQKLYLSGQTPYIDTKPLFPELFNEPNPELVFSQPAIEFDYSKPSPFTYKIDINADKAKYWLYTFEEASLSILPHKEGAEIPITVKNFYKGKLTANLIVGNILNIKGQVSGLTAESLMTPLNIVSPITGALSASADLKSSGKSPEEFLTNMGGTLQVSIKNGNFANGKTKTPFNEITLQSNAKGMPASGENPLHPVQGSWNLSMKTPDMAVQANVPSGIILFDPKSALPLSMSSTSAKVRIQSGKTESQAEGKLSFDLAKNTLAFQSFTGSYGNLSYSGSAFLNSFTNPQVTGSLQGQTSAFFPFLKSVGLPVLSVPNIDSLGLFDFQTTFNFSNNALKFNDISGMLDNTHYTGDLTLPANPKEPLLVHLNVDTLNLDRYTPLFVSKTPNSDPLPFDFLLNSNLLGSFTAKELWFGQTPFLNFTLPFTLNKGELSITCTANFPTAGTLNAEFTGYTSPNSLQVNTGISLKNLNLLSLTQARGQEGLIAGTASFQLNAITQMRSMADLFTRLSGSWSLEAGEGFFAQAFPKEPSTSPLPKATVLNPTSNRTHFSSITASGPIQNGVFVSNNLRLQSPAYQVLGVLQIDLPKWTINLDADAYLGQITTVPIKVSGSIDDPNLNVKIITAITSTIASITGGVLNTLTNIITAPLRAF